MFAAWREWVPPGSRVALLEPSYGEYDHLTREVRGAEAHHSLLTAEDRFRFCPTQWLSWINEVRPAVAALVNPNNPTGTTFDIAELVPHLPRETLLWVDEAYIDYTHAETAEGLAANSDNVVVVKSLSKGYGLSGIRAAYLVGSPDRLASLRPHLPPWAVSFMAQFFGVKVWDYAAYYRARYRETEELRAEFVARLSTVPGGILADCANWVLFKLPPTVTAEAAVSRLIARGIYIRDAGKTAASLGDSVVRIAVRPQEEQERLVQALAEVLQH
jgi:histidinol-phosphate/aromatic aminotransferase/cobyric acid decarboxylase-like protein